MFEKCFLFHLKSSVLENVLFCLVGERLDKKAKVNLNIYDVTTWITSNNNTQNDR